MEKTYYDELETMPRKQKEKYYDEKVSWVVQHAYKYAPAIKAKMDHAGVSPSDIRTVRDLEKIPITRKDELVKMQKEDPPFGGLLAVPLNKLNSICMSAGPIYNTTCNDQSYLHRVKKSLCGCGLRPGDIVQNTASYHISMMGTVLDAGIRGLGITVIPMGGGNRQLQAQVMHDLKVTVYTGTAGFLLEILRTAEEMGYNPRKDFNIRLAIGPLDHDSMKIIEKDYGIMFTEFYGNAEVGTVAYNCGERSGMHICEEMIVEIVDIDTGSQLGPHQVGMVVVTPLDETFPLIRFGTNDLSSWDDKVCLCGRTSYRLNPIVGWVGDAVKVRGLFVHPAQLAGVVAKFAPIEKYQLVCRRVGERDFLLFRYEVKVGYGDVKEIEGPFRVNFRDVCRLNLNEIECVPQGTILHDSKTVVDERPPGSK